MNLRYLGDALDHWKGSLLERLTKKDLLMGLQVDPMASDSADWQEADWKLFADLLRVQENQIAKHCKSLVTERPHYFDEICGEGDLFMDPDTGIATGRVADYSQYLRPAELNGLLSSDKPRVVAVYQHIRAQKVRDRLQNVVTALKHHVNKFTCCSYESGTVAMLFLSIDEPRVTAIHAHFTQWLGSRSACRIYRWTHPAQCSGVALPVRA